METLTFRQPRLVALMLLVVIAAGLSALTAIGRQEDPTITNLFGTVETPFPGADPERVETLVTSDIEDMLLEISEVDVIESASSTGMSIVTVELAPTTPDGRIEEVWTEIRDGLSDLSPTLPDGVQEPQFNTDGAGAYAAIFALSAPEHSVSPTIMARYAEDFAQDMRSVPGTQLVDLFGIPEEEVLVEIDPLRATSLGLSAASISASIQAADSRSDAGRVRGDTADFLINVDGEVEALDRLREVVVREGSAGQATRLADIATISRGAREPVSELAIYNGRPAILIAAKLEEGLQVDVWAGFLKEDIAAYQAILPDALSLDMVFDQSRYTAERLTEVGINMAIGVGLVVGVLLVTLGIRSALIVAVILPVVTLASLATMNFMGLPIHQMSVTGLIVALGLLVDAGIVMTDEIGARLREGLSRLEAVYRSVRRLFAPLLASTVTTALSFTPLILLPGAAGDFVGAIAIAVVTMLVWSFLVAMTITPAIAGLMLRNDANNGGLHLPWIAKPFRATLAWSVANPVRSVALALVLPVTGFLSMPSLTAQFFPGVDRDQFYIELDMAPGTALSATTEEVERIDALLRADERVTSLVWVTGRSAPAFYYNILGGRENAPSYAQALVTTSSPEATEDIVTALQRDLTASAPGAQLLVRGLVQGPPVAAPVELRVVGQDLAVLREVGDEARRLMSDLDMVTLARSTVTAGAPKAVIHVDEAEARRLGLDLTNVARQLQAGLEGVTGGVLVEGTEQLPIRVRYGDGERASLERIVDLPLLSPGSATRAASGQWPGLPLSAIASMELEPAAGTITRRNGERVNTVQAFILRGVLPQEALDDVQLALDEAGFALPPGYRLEYGGDSDARADTLGNLFASLGLIITLSIAAIVLTFNSFRLSGVTLVVAGLSAGLSLLSLAVFQYPFGINAIIGVIGSIGVSINAAIILMTGLRDNDAAKAGDQAAMVDVVMGSSRHITSTTITTFGGFLPLILAGGGFWPPFAMSVAGGVLLSTIVSFYFVPPMFRLVYAGQVKARGQGKAKTAPANDDLIILRAAAE